MLLQNKNVIIYGGGGSIGSAMAHAFAKAGANLFLTGHQLASVQRTADAIIAAGGNAQAAAVDALNPESVNDHLEMVGRVDVSFNVIGWKDKQDQPLIEMTPDDFLRPVHIALETNFITGTAAGRIMKEQGSGVILTLTATPGGIGYPNVGGFGPACCVVEAFSRNLASELGTYGVRAVNIRSGGSPDSRPFMEAVEQMGQPALDLIQKIKDDTMLKEMPLMEDIGNVAVFLSSDMSKKITGVTIDVTCGTTSALNYKVPVIPFVDRE